VAFSYSNVISQKRNSLEGKLKLKAERRKEGKRCVWVDGACTEVIEEKEGGRCNDVWT
jgi:hypothetical protein